MAKRTQRRRLYGKRRQRGGMARWKVLLVALTLVPKAAAQTIVTLVSKWWSEGGWQNSKNLADALLLQDLSYPPEVKAGLQEIANSTVTNATGVTPTHTDANETAVKPFLNASAVSSVPLPPGNYTVGLSPSPEERRFVVTDLTGISDSDKNDISLNTEVTFVGDAKLEDDEGDETIPAYVVKRRGDDRKYTLPVSSLSPFSSKAGRRRTTRRKTLRKKK